MPPEGANDVCENTHDSRTETEDLLTNARRYSSNSHDEGEGKAGATPAPRLSIVSVVKLLFFVDMLSVALVVPLLSSYFRDLDISTELYGMMSSFYSLAQIAGGLIFNLGAMSDRSMSRRSALVLSFAGSCVSYAMIGLSNSLSMLLLSRIIVGMVKQTMTISTAIVSENTTAENRSKELSRLTAAMTFAFILGPSLGSLLYRQHKILPPMISSSLFLLNALLVLLLLPGDTGAGGAAAGKLKKDDDSGGAGNEGEIGKEKGDENGKSTLESFMYNIKLVGRDSGTMRIVAARVIFGFFMRSLAGQNFVGYFEERFGVETWVKGYVVSYGAGLGFLVQLYAVGPIISRVSETTVVWLALATVTLTNLAEACQSLVDLKTYLAFVVPPGVIAHSVIGACLQSIFTQRVPQADLGSALGTVNVLLSISGVVGPLYGGKIMGLLGVLKRPAVTSAHYAAFFVLWGFMEMRKRGGSSSKSGKTGVDDDSRLKVE